MSPSEPMIDDTSNAGAFPGLRRIDGESSPRGGPRARRWQVNPALAAA